MSDDDELETYGSTFNFISLRNCNTLWHYVLTFVHKVVQLLVTERYENNSRGPIVVTAEAITSWELDYLRIRYC